MLCGEILTNANIKPSCLTISKYDFLFSAYCQNFFIFVYFLMHRINMVVHRCDLQINE